MKVLDVSPRIAFPTFRGVAVRLFNLLVLLSERHEVRQFSYTRVVDDPGGPRLEERWHTPSYCELRHRHPFARLGEIGERAWVTGPVLSGALLRAYSPPRLRELVRSWADVVVVEYPWQFEACRRLRPGVPLVLATHNVEVEKYAGFAAAAGRAARHSPWLAYVRRAEANAVRASAAVVVVSPDDRLRMIERYGAHPDRVVVVPNGADVRRYRPVDDQTRRRLKHELGLPERQTAIFIASNVPPNRAAVAWIRQVARRAPDTTFLVAGPVSAPTRVEGNLVYTGVVDDDRPYLGAADLALCPIQFGGGTKIKLLQALASGLPTIAFAEAAHGLALRPDEHLLVVEKSLDALSAAVTRLAEDRDLAERLGASGAAFVAAEHDWRQSARLLEQALAEVCSAARRDGSGRRSALPSGVG